MNRNLVLVSLAAALAGTAGIYALFTSNVQESDADLPVPAEVIAAPGQPVHTVSPMAEAPLAHSDEQVVDEPRDEPQLNATRYGPNFKTQREQVLDPGEIARRDALRESHQQRIVDTTLERFRDFARDEGVSEETVAQVAIKLENHLHDSRAVREAARDGTLTREEAKEELGALRLEIESELLHILGDDGYQQLRKAVPGKW